MAIRTKIFTLFTLAFAVTAFSVFASAQDTAPAVKEGDKKVEKFERKGMGRKGGFGRMGGRMGKMGRMGGMHGMGMHGITLTDAQKEQIKAIHEANKPTAESMEQMKSFREARKAGTLTDAQKEQMKQFREARKAKMEAVHAQVLAILTPEQKAQIEVRKAEMKQRMEERRERRQNRRPGEMKKPAVKPTDNN